MFKKTLLVIALGSAAASAQGTEAPAPAPAPAPMPTGADAFQKGTLGITFALNLSAELGKTTLGEPVPTIGIMYFLSEKAALRLTAGINVHKEQIVLNTTPPTTSDTTVVGFALGAGYRMYRPVKAGRMHPYIEPEVTLAWPDTSQSAALLFGLGGQFGMEAQLADWFTLSGGVGADLDFQNSFKDIRFATAARFAANFYWK